MREHNHKGILSSKERRLARLEQNVPIDKLISNRRYNLIFGLVVLYGLIVNTVTCALMETIKLPFSPLTIIIGYFVLAIIGCIIASSSSNPIVSFIGYNLVCVPLGFMLSLVLRGYGGIQSDIVQMAFGCTAFVTTVMITASVIRPQWFAKLGPVLFVALVSLILLRLVLFIFRIDFLGILPSVIATVIFSLYIGYDFYRSQRCPKTVDNAVDSALDVYLDVINLFLNILRILGNTRKK